MSIRFILVAGFVSCLLLGPVSCVRREQLEKARTDLEKICKNLPVPPDLIETGSEKTVDVAKVVFFRRFKTRSKCEPAGKFFRDHFLGMGWDEKQMTSEISGGGMKTLDFDFRNEEYLVSVECQTDNVLDRERVVVIGCSWGLR